MHSLTIPHLSFTKALQSSENRHCLPFTVRKVGLKEMNSCSSSQGLGEEKLNYQCERMSVEGENIMQILLFSV